VNIKTGKEIRNKQRKNGKEKQNVYPAYRTGKKRHGYLRAKPSASYPKPVQGTSKNKYK
jgi:hypothetical protein